MIADDTKGRIELKKTGTIPASDGEYKFIGHGFKDLLERRAIDAI